MYYLPRGVVYLSVLGLIVCLILSSEGDRKRQTSALSIEIGRYHDQKATDIAKLTMKPANIDDGSRYRKMVVELRGLLSAINDIRCQVEASPSQRQGELKSSRDAFKSRAQELEALEKKLADLQSQ
jgi:hypothetical protein